MSKSILNGNESFEPINRDSFYQIEADFHDQVAEKARGDLALRCWEEPIWKFTLQVMGDVRGKRILDVGCGTGRFSIRCAEMGATVTGIDISEKTIALAKVVTKKAGVDVNYFVGNIDKFNFDDKFDILLCKDVLHHMPEVRQTLKHCLDLLKPGGLILMEEPRAENLVAKIGRKYFQEVTSTESPFKTGELEKIIGEMFQQMDVRYYYILSPLSIAFNNNKLKLLRSKKLNKISFQILYLADRLLLLMPLMMRFTWLEVVYGRKRAAK